MTHGRVMLKCTSFWLAVKKYARIAGISRAAFDAACLTPMLPMLRGRRHPAWHNMKTHNRNPLLACQFAVVAVNGKYAVIVEVKRQLTLQDVRDFADESLPRFAGAFPQMASGKKIVGAMVYRRTHPGGSAVAAALKEGFLVLGVNNNNTLYQVKSAKDITNQAKKREVKK